MTVHTTSEEDSVDAELAALRAGYVDMFGVLPPLPAGKFAYLGDADPELLLLVERLRARAFTNDVFDPAITQLIILAIMLAGGGGAAEWHAIAARRAGATWEQLQTVVALATAVSALGPANVGGALLHRLATAPDDEQRNAR